MRFSMQSAIDAAAAICLIALLFVPTIDQNARESHARAAATAHRVATSATHHHAVRPLKHVAPAE